MKLKEVCETFTDGDWIESKNQSNEGLRLIQTGNIGEGKYIEKMDRAKYISEDTFVNLKCTEVFPGDILVSRLPEPVGRACIIPEKTERMITAVDCTICRPNEEVTSKEYLNYFMQSKTYYNRLSNKITGTTRKRISRKNLGEIEITIPDKSVQDRVVYLFDLLSSIIVSRKEEIKKFDELIKSRFVEMFRDSGKFKQEPLKNNVQEMFIGPFGSALKSECFVSEEEGFCIVYEQKHAIKKTMNVDTRYVDEKKYKELKRFTIYPGDIIVSCRGTIGEIFIVPKDAPLGVMHPSIMKIRLDTKKYKRKFFAFLLEEYMQENREKNKGSGVKMAVTAKALGKEKFIVPQISVQERFTNFVNQIDKLKFGNYK